MYTSGETGVIDGVVIAWGAFMNWKLYEVYNYHTQVYFSQSNSHFVFNLKTFEKFSSDDQKRIEQLAPWFQNAITMATALPTGPDVFKKINKAAGHEIYNWPGEDLAQARAAQRPLWDEWAEKMEAKGYPGKELVAESDRLIRWFTDDFSAE